VGWFLCIRDWVLSDRDRSAPRLAELQLLPGS
jgi:hypothetical protein